MIIFLKELIKQKMLADNGNRENKEITYVVVRKHILVILPYITM